MTALLEPPPQQGVSKLPNFFVVGAEKAGTTALYEYLKQHPQIYLPDVKEPIFFATGRSQRRVTTWEDYLSLYRQASGEIALGDMSPEYLQSLEAPQNITRYIPDAKIIIFLRNPVERAYSHFMMLLNSHSNIPYQNFEDFFRDKHSEVERWRDRSYPSYGLRLSFYAESLKRYYDLFNREQVRVFLYEDFFSNPNMILRNICDFLCISPTFEFQSPGRINKGYGLPKSKLIHRRVIQLGRIAKVVLPKPCFRVISDSIMKAVTNPKPRLSHNVKLEFIQVYLEDIKRSEQLLERDLSIWYN